MLAATKPRPGLPADTAVLRPLLDEFGDADLPSPQGTSSRATTQQRRQSTRCMVYTLSHIGITCVTSFAANPRDEEKVDRNPGHPAFGAGKLGDGLGQRSGTGPFFQYPSTIGRLQLRDMDLAGKVAVVTGGTKGVGRGVARELSAHAARVFITGRSVSEHEQIDGRITGFRCDHRIDTQVEAAFHSIVSEAKTVDVLVNNVWGGYDGMIENGDFTWPKPFWEQPLWRWDAMFGAGVRAHYYATQLAAPAMIAQRRGLIVNISFWAAQKYIGNVAYGVSKAATDKMTADMSVELKPHGVAVVSLYPGLVRTEKVMEAAQFLDLTNSESPEFIGRAVAALATDPNAQRHTGNVLVAAALAQEYGFTDIDGKRPLPLTLANV